MPIIHIEWYEGRTREQKETVVTEVTDTLVRTLDISPDSVTIIFDELKQSNCARGGKLLG